MRKFVISLSSESRRRNLFIQNNRDLIGDFEFYDAVDKQYITPEKMQEIGADVWRGWRDPFKNRTISIGEIACFLSHRNLWVECKNLNEPILILEDDAVVNEWDETLYDSLLEDYNFIYLGRNENEPDKVIDVSENLEIPSFPYNLHAYIITPESAHILLNSNIIQNIIPVDDYVPMVLGQLNPIAIKNDHVGQLSQGALESSVEVLNESEYYFGSKLHVLTVGTDRKKSIRLMTSAMKSGVDVKNLGENVTWKGTDMSGPGGGMKLNLIKEYIKDKPNHDVVLFTDAYDVFYCVDQQTILERFLGFHTRALFSAELSCWPDESLAEQYPESETDHKYLNSGTFIAEVGELRSLLDFPIADDEDDQLFLTKQFLSGNYDMKLDYESYIFHTHDEQTIINEGQVFNPKTQCFSCVYHGNGGDDAKETFDRLYDELYPQVINFFVQSDKYNKIDYLDNEMLVVDFMTPDYCEQLIELSEKYGRWGELDGDKFPAQEIRIKQLGIDLWNEMELHWEKYINPIVEKYWHPLLMYGLRDAFTMRYALDTQTSLALHHDASLVTGSVKLNSDYEGADLVFPRQGFTNKDVPVGRCILFPGQVTHGHTCEELTSGVKYSLTMWTSRYEGDIN